MKLTDMTLKLLGLRNGFSPKISNLLKQISNEKITSVVISRQPIQSAINTLLNVLTFGEYDKHRQKMNYDDYFHLKLIINNKYILEKNERINIDYYKKSNGEQYMNVNDNYNHFSI